MQKAILAVIALSAAAALLLPAQKPEPRPQAPQPERPQSSWETRLERKENGQFYVDAEVNGGQFVNFMVDTGASVVALTQEDAQRLGVNVSPSDFEVVGRGASGEVRGKPVRLDRISIEGKEVLNVRAAVIENLHVSLLGQSYLSQLGGIETSGDTMILR